MPTAVENYIFNELPRRVVIDPSIATGSSFTAAWLLAATGVGTQAIPIDPNTLGFEPKVTPPDIDPGIKFWNGNKDWVEISAAAISAIPTSEKGQALGVATLDADGFVQLSQMNPAVIERVVVVADEAARYALTTAQVQNGDVVNQQSPLPGTMWYVVDDTNLDNSAGYLSFSAGAAASVAWSGITGKPAIIGELENITLSSEGDVLQYVGGVWTKVSPATLKTSLALEIADINSLQDDLDGKQSQSDVLDNVSEISTTGIIVRDPHGDFLGRELVGINGIDIAEPKGEEDNPTISLTETGVTAGTYGNEYEHPVVEVDSYGRVVAITEASSSNKEVVYILDQPTTQLLGNTRHIFGGGVVTYSSNILLELPENVPGGTWVKILCAQNFSEASGTIGISATNPTTVQGTSLFDYTAFFKLYPFTVIDLVYSSSADNWTLTTNATSFLSSLHVARQGATDGVSNSHEIISNATSPRSLSIPDRDVDLSSVGQTDFLDADFRISDDDDQSKKVAFSVGAISAGQTRVVTIPDHNVDLGLVGKTDFADNVFRVSDSSDATKKIAFQASGIATDQVRTITMPNADVDLGKVPTNLAYDSATAVLTQTLTDATSLSADLSAIAVNQVALTGGPTVTVTGTQSSTKYFLAGSTASTFDVTAFTNTGKFIEIVNNRGFYTTITLTATGRNFRDEANDLITFPAVLVRGESLVVFPVNATTLQVYRNKPDIRNIKNNSNTVISGFKTTNLFVDSSTTVGQISPSGDELVRIFALAQATLSFGYPVYDARTDTQISAGSYTMYAGQVIEVTKTSTTKWVVLGGHIQDTSMFRLYNSSNVPTKFDTSAATAEHTIIMPNVDVNLGKVAQAASRTSDGYLSSTAWSTFNNKLGLADVRYVFLNDSTTTQTTYTVPASAVTAVGRTIIELSNSSLTSITVDTATGTGKVDGDSVNISITGTYAAQVLVASGVTLQGDLTFSYPHQTKTLVYKGSNVWKVVG